MSLTGQLGTESIPVSVLYDKNGQEIARILGIVNWQSEEARALLREVLGPQIEQ